MTKWTPFSRHFQFIHFLIGGSRVIHFLQMRRFLRSLDGSTNSVGSPKCFTLPLALWSCYMTKHQRMAQVRLVSSLALWVVDGTITSSCLVILSQQSTDALNLYGQLLLNEDNAIGIVLSITILQNQQKVPCCHDRFMKFKMNRYHCKNDEIHGGLGVT